MVFLRRFLVLGSIASSIVAASAAMSCTGTLGPNLDGNGSGGTSSANGATSGAGAQGSVGSGGGNTSSNGPSGSTAAAQTSAQSGGQTSAQSGVGGATAASGNGGAAVTSGTDGATSSSDATTGSGSATTSGSGSTGSGPIRPGDYDCSSAAGSVPPLKLTPVASNLAQPTLAKGAPGDVSRLFIVQQEGVIRVVSDGNLLDTPFLDLTSVVQQTDFANDERGLLGLAFHPDYDRNGRFFVHYTASSDEHPRIVEFARSSDPDVADPSPVATVLTHSYTLQGNHNGGSIEFSPADGMLYIGFGDGGGSGDPNGNGQSTNTFLGKVLRIDVSTLPYTTPDDNLGGGALPEIWDYGLRNPWRFSFDGCTGDFYLGDVGQGAREEVNVEPAGEGRRNYGWRLKEGTACYLPSTNCDPTNMTIPPIAEMTHGTGACSIIGGYVYRGSNIPGLRGSYLYGDFCSGNIFRLTWQNGSASAPVNLTSDLGSSNLNISSFGQDAAGEVYVVDYNGTVYRIDAE